MKANSLRDKKDFSFFLVKESRFFLSIITELCLIVYIVCVGLTKRNLWRKIEMKNVGIFDRFQSKFVFQSLFCDKIEWFVIEFSTVRRNWKCSISNRSHIINECNLSNFCSFVHCGRWKWNGDEQLCARTRLMLNDVKASFFSEWVWPPLSPCTSKEIARAKKQHHSTHTHISLKPFWILCITWRSRRKKSD